MTIIVNTVLHDERNNASIGRFFESISISLSFSKENKDGCEVAEKLKEDFLTQNIPIIFLTALLSRKEEYRKNHIIAGNITFAKPVDPEELLGEIKTLMETAAI